MILITNIRFNLTMSSDDSAMSSDDSGSQLNVQTTSKVINIYRQTKHVVTQLTMQNVRNYSEFCFNNRNKIIAAHCTEKMYNKLAFYMNGKIYIFHLEDAKVVVDGMDAAFCAAFSPDGKTLVVGFSDSSVKLLDAASGRILRKFDGHSEEVYTVSFSPDGKTFASASTDANVKLWKVSSGRCLKTLTHSEDVYNVSFSQNGSMIATAAGLLVKLWDVTSGECFKTLNGHSGKTRCVSFSPDGTRVASGSYDNMVKLWDVRSGKCLHTFTGHRGIVNSVLFSQDGSKLASVSHDRTVKFWHTGEDKRMLKSIQLFIIPTQLSFLTFNRTTMQTLCLYSDTTAVQFYEKKWLFATNANADNSFLRNCSLRF